MNFIASLLGFSTTTGHQDKNNSETPKPSHHLLEIINNQTIPNNTHMESKILNKNPTNEGLTLPAASRVTESITRSPTLAPEKTPENKAVLTLKEVEGTLQIYRSTLHEIKDKRCS